MASDITERKKLETAKSLFVSFVAHEIKSPLAAAEEMLMLVNSEDFNLNEQKKREFVTRSLARIKALRLLISDLTSLTALETGNFPIQRINLNIRDVLAEILPALEEKARLKKISLRISEPSGPESVFADQNAMRIVLNNLIDNATKIYPGSWHGEREYRKGRHRHRSDSGR